MKFIYVFTISLLTSNLILAQSFSGRLTYKSVTDDSMFFIESFRKLSYDVDTLSFGRIDNIWVKKDSIKTLLISNRGQFNRSDYQYGDVAYEVINFNGKIKRERIIIFPAAIKYHEQSFCKCPRSHF